MPPCAVVSSADSHAALTQMSNDKESSGQLRNPPVASSQPSFKRPPAAFPAASEDFSQKSCEISGPATSQGTYFFEISIVGEIFSEYVFFNVFFEIVLIL